LATSAILQTVVPFDSAAGGETIMTQTYTATAGEFLLVFISTVLEVVAGGPSGFNLFVDVTGQTTQDITQSGPFVDGDGSIVSFVGRFGPLAAGSVTVNVRAQMTSPGSTGETAGEGSTVLIRSAA
jgi:hypothetical protein